MIVVDDRNRFALHAWRYVGRSIGFGNGTVDESGHPHWPWRERTRSADAEPWVRSGAHPLKCSNPRCRVWWVCAAEGWQGHLAEIAAEIGPSERVLVLVDVNLGRDPHYDYRQVEDRLREFLPGNQPTSWYISAYHPPASGQAQVVRTKTRETLREARRWLLGGAASSEERPRAERVRTRHVLVTGAGFEIAEPRNGLGLPPTRRLLMQMGHPFGNGEGEVPLVDLSALDRPERTELGLPSEPHPGEFPIPSRGIWDGMHDRAQIARISVDANLDEWWNFLLRTELIRNYKGKPSNESQIILRERRLRTAFRAAILRYDWGHLGQCLRATEFSWLAWLSTNYTRFVNRAIHKAARLRNAEPWRIVTTSEEARSISMDADLRISERDAVPVVFKLHGGIEHTHTMAIAGYDKAALSPLAMHVDTLHDVFVAADRHLMARMRRLADSPDDPGAGPLVVVWHIVGHSLFDERLTKLIADVCRATRGEVLHRFVIVNTVPGVPETKLTTALEEVGVDEASIGECIETHELRALEYLEWIAEAAPPTRPDWVDDLQRTP